MPELLSTNSELSQKVDELACYEQTDAQAIVVSATTAIEDNCHLQQHCYLLPLGRLRLLNSTLHLPASASKDAIEGARQAAIKSALAWQKRCVQQNNNENVPLYCVLTIDIKLDHAVDDVLSTDKKKLASVKS